MQHLRHCLNPKVVGGLVVVAAVIWVVAPGALAAALPMLVVAICPLSMLAMVLLMRDGGHDTGDPKADPVQRARLAAATRSVGPADDGAGPVSEASARR